MLTNIQPAGEHLFEDLQRAGGVPALLSELAPLLHLDALTVTGRTLGENIAGAEAWDRDVLRSLDDPLLPSGGLAVLAGTLAPDGAVIKAGAASAELLQHRGPALVFDGIDDLLARIDGPDLPVEAASVLVLRGAGPKGAPGMPEWGMLPIPRKLLEQGVTDMVRVSDARMSGTGYGTVVLHVAPESAVGGPLHAVNDGDEIVLDTAARRLDVCVEPAEIARRLAARPLPEPPFRRGYGSIYLEARPAGRRRSRLRRAPSPTRGGWLGAARTPGGLDQWLVSRARTSTEADRRIRTVTSGSPGDLEATSADDLISGFNRAYAGLTAPGAPFAWTVHDVRGVPTRIFDSAPPHMRAIWEMAATKGDAEYLVYGSERYSYSDASARVRSLAHHLRDEHGVGRGDRVAIAMRNYPEWVLSYWAITSLGAAAVAVNSWWTGPELAFALGDSSPVVAILDGERLERLSLSAGTPALIVTRHDGDLPARAARWDDGGRRRRRTRETA